MNTLSALGGVSITNPAPLDLSRPVGLWLSSDWHVGAANCDVKRIKKDLDAAVKRRDRILINGDIFDGIVIGDPRFDASTLHPRLRRSETPMDEATTWAAELLEPAAAAGLVDYIGHGNHETKLQNKAGISLLAALRLKLGPWADRTPQPSGYSGFLNYRLNVGGRKAGRYVVFAHHGSKGGVRQLQTLSTIADADLIWTGHYHQKHSTGRLTVRPSECGRRMIVRERRQVMTGAYTFAYGANRPGEARDNYAGVAGYVPGLLGGARVVLSWVDDQLNVEVRS